MEIVALLAELYRKQGKADKAQVLIDHVLARDAPELAERVQYSALADEFARADALAATGKIEEAGAKLEALMTRTQDPALREQLSRQIQELRAVQLRNRAVEEYNQALEHARAGRLREARPLLEKVLGATTDPEVESAARDLLQQIEARLPKRD
jgi:hypothetical protein